CRLGSLCSALVHAAPARADPPSERPSVNQTPLSPPVPVTAAYNDALHAAAAGRGISSRLYAEAFGEEYPAQVDPSSSCTWSVLGEMVKRLRLRPDGLLVDLGCGRGGTGLWLARAFSARLIGLDISAEAVGVV